MSGFQKMLGGLALLVALCAGGVVGAAGTGHKYGAWNLDFAYNTLIQYGFFAAVAAGALALIAIVIGLLRGKLGGFFTALLAAIVAAGVAYVPWTMRAQAAALPALTDITTDTQSPPPFVELVNVRKPSANGETTYNPQNAAKQKQAYPDVVTFVSSDNPAVLFGKANAAIKKLGWQMVASKPEEGRLEATSVSEWFGFKDDVVVRIAAKDGGAVLDIRSASREGTTDFGANAEHIRSLLALVK